MSQGGADSILSVYSDARAEYTKQLCVYLVPAYFQFYTDLLEKSRQAMTSEPKKTLWQFQNYLNEIHDWNMEKINHEIYVIHQNSGCDYLEELLTAVFIAHTKVLTAIRLNASSKKVEINIPKVDHFLFKVLCETARLLWSSTYLFRDGIPAIERQQNYRTIEGLLNEGIMQAVRSLVPVKSILKDFVNSDTVSSTREEHEESDEEMDTEMGSESQTASLGPKAASLESQAASLESQTASLESQTASLESQTASLESQTASLESQTASLESQTDLLELKSESINLQPEILEPKAASLEPKAASLEPKMAPSTNPAEPLIVLDQKPSVRFGQFNTVFGMDNPADSDMIYDSPDSSSGLPDLDILEGSGEPLDGSEFLNLDDELSPSEPVGISSADYEELSL